MRIGMIMDTPFPPDARVENEARTLIGAGHEVVLFTVDYPGGVHPVGVSMTDDTVEGIRIVRHSGSQLMYKLSALVYTVPFWRWWITPYISRFIENQHLDVLHIHDMVIAEAAMRANRKFRLPVVLDLHENRPAIMKLYKHVNSGIGRWLIDLDRWERRQRELMRQADRLILVTEEARHVAAESSGIPVERTASVPNVVRLETFDRASGNHEVPGATSSGSLGTGSAGSGSQDSGSADSDSAGSDSARHGSARGSTSSGSADSGSNDFGSADSDPAGPGSARYGSTSSGSDTSDDRTFTLLYIGDTSLRRGTMTALEAVEKLRHQIPELHLILVGSSSQDDVLQRYVKRNHLGSRVTFAGWQPPDRLPGYIRGADLCLSPLLRNLHHDTTYANKLFQYMAGGRAVVVSDCTAQAAVVRTERCGLVHRAGDASDLARAVDSLYRDPVGASEMGVRGREAVEKRWCWEVTGPRLLSVYNALQPT